MIGLLEMCLTNMGHEIQPGMVLYDTIAAVNAVHKVYSSMQVCREGGREGGRREGGLFRVLSGPRFIHSNLTLYWKLTFLKFVFL